MGTRISRYVFNNFFPHAKGFTYIRYKPLKADSFFFFGHAVSDPAIPHSVTTTTRSPQGEELTPIDLDDEELAAYAEECAAMADFDDIPEEELFSWSDLEEPDEHEYDMDIA